MMIIRPWLLGPLLIHGSEVYKGGGVWWNRRGWAEGAKLVVMKVQGKQIERRHNRQSEAAIRGANFKI